MMNRSKQLDGEVDRVPLITQAEEENLEDDFVEVEDCVEDHFVLVDQEPDEKAEIEDEDFVLTHVEEEADEKAKNEHKADLVAVARTKQLVFFLSLVVTSYVVAINTVAGIFMLAKSIHTLEFKSSKTPGSITGIIFDDVKEKEAESEQAFMDRPRPRLNIPSLSSASSKVLQPARMMIPRPSCRLEEPVLDSDAHFMPSPTIVDTPLSVRLGISPPDVDALTYHTATTVDQNQEPSPGVWPQPTPRPRRTYPSLEVVSIMESTKTADVVVVGEIIHSPPKPPSFNLPSVGGNIPYSPSLHIPSVAVDRVRSFWNWGRSESKAKVVESTNTTTAAFVPVPGNVSKTKNALDSFIQSSGDHAVVLFYESSSDYSRELLSVWQTLSEKVRYTMMIDCIQEPSLCNVHGHSLPFALMIKERKLEQPVQLDYDPLHMFTNFIKSIEDTAISTTGYSPPTNRAVATSLSQYTFRGFLAQNKHVAVMFGHLDAVVWSVLNSLSQGLEEQGLNAVVAVVDCHSNPMLCRDQRIEKYPTVRWFSNGEASAPDFEKQLVKKKFVKYARRVLAGIA